MNAAQRQKEDEREKKRQEKEAARLAKAPAREGEAAQLEEKKQEQRSEQVSWCCSSTQREVSLNSSHVTCLCCAGRRR
jgi:hypothetical protein